VQEELTIDQLAQQVGLPSSTIRLYQTRGLLPAPRRQGRVAWYGAGHVARIDLIGRLQERGFSLAAIGELVQGWEEGHSLDQVLGLEQAVPGRRPAAELRLTPAALAARFPGTEISAEVVRQVVELGLVGIEADGTLLIRSPVFLEVGSALVALGIPLADVLDEAVRLEADMAVVAERFAGLFDRHLWRPFADAGMPPDRLPEVTEALTRLAPLADAVVHTTLQRALAAVADRFLADEAARRAGDPDPGDPPGP
jgi:DNA-binding transcriptional MerR regulator